MSNPSPPSVAGSVHTARALFVQSLLPAYERFLECHGSSVIGLRSDIVAVASVAESCLNLIDHVHRECRSRLSSEGSGRLTDYRKSLEQRCSGLPLVFAIANAWKHKVLDKGSPPIKSLSDIGERMAIIRLVDNGGYYYYMRKFLLAVGENGAMQLVDVAIAAAVEAWAAELVRLNVIATKPSLRPHPPYHRARNDVPVPLRMECVAHAGEYTEFDPISLVYDPGEPIRRMGLDDEFDTTYHLAIRCQRSPLGVEPRKPDDDGDVGIRVWNRHKHRASQPRELR